MKLLIVESPNKAKKIQQLLGGAYRVVASMGHIYDLPKHELGVSLPTYRPTYVERDGGKGIKRLRDAMAGVTEVFVASDPDREGEAIAAHVARALQLRQPKRVRFDQVTESAIRQALANATTIDRRLVDAQEARRVLDRLVGYLVSPRISSLVGLKLSAGRVQSPAVRLVVERELAIRGFKPTTHYGALLHFDQPSPWTAKWNHVPQTQAELCIDKALAIDASKTGRVVVTNVEKTRAARRPPAPLITSTLQQVASVRLKLRPQQTMELAQELFEAGHITYHRTDNPNLSDEGAAAARTWLRDNGHGALLANPPHRWKAQEGAQVAHEAIRPTHFEEHRHCDNRAPLPGVSAQATELYQLIWLFAVVSQLRSASYDVTVIELQGRTPGNTMGHFVAKGRVIVDAGWMMFQGVASDDEEQDADDAALPDVAIAAELVPRAGEVTTHQTKAPARYTEASLIRALEEHGIGRPSTYASILGNITEREYVKLNRKRQLEAADAGILVVELLKPCRFMELAFTRGLENGLDRIASGQLPYADLLTALHTLLQDEIGRLAPPAPHLVPMALRGKLSTQPTETYPCPLCEQGRLNRKANKTGGHFWACNQFHPDKSKGCRYTAPDVDGRPGRRKPGPPGKPADDQMQAP